MGDTRHSTWPIVNTFIKKFIMRTLLARRLQLVVLTVATFHLSHPSFVAAQSVSPCRAAFDSTRLEGVRPNARDPLVIREVTYEVARPVDVYVADFILGGTNLENFLHGTESVPGVDHNEVLSGGDFPTVGSRRLVCLKGGGSAVEEVLLHEPRRLRYLVTDYTLPAARPIAYAIGEFVFDSLSAARTRVTWRYSFKLRTNTFPGRLGPLGRYLFRRSFVDRDYARFMDAAVDVMAKWRVRTSGARRATGF